MKRKQGFTLVELLVVIGIIALLISILLPALSKARRQSILVACMSNLRQIGVATFTYAADNKGALPPYRFDTGLSTYDLKPNLNYSWTQQFGDTPDSGALVGRLVVAKYCPNADIEYCPATQANSSDPKFYDEAYQYNVHQCLHTAGLFGATVQQPWWKKVTNFGKVLAGPIKAVNASLATTGTYTFEQIPRALANDNLDLANITVGSTRGTHAVGNDRAWNLLFIDGSVLTAHTDARFARTGGTWGRDLDSLDNLELLCVNQLDRGSVINNTWQNKVNWIPVNPPN